MTSAASLIEENVVSQAGTTFRMGVADMQRLIRDLDTSLISGQLVQSSKLKRIKSALFALITGLLLKRLG